MFKNYLKITFRHIIKQKRYSLVVISGLAISMAAAFLIYSFVFFEKSYDNFHANVDKLYRVVVDAQKVGDDAYKSPFSYAGQGPVALEEVPEIEAYTRLFPMENIVVSKSTNLTSGSAISVDNFYYVDDNFLTVFTFPFVQGDTESALKEPGTVAISETMAQNIFGDENPIGKKIIVDGEYHYTVKGVFRDIPDNSHLKFSMLFSLNTFPWIMNSGNVWNNHSFFTYFLLKEGANAKEVEKKITLAYHKENRAVDQIEEVWLLQPISEAYLNTSDFTSKPKAFKFGNQRMVYFLSLIAILILCIAWINYINLTTAKTSERLKEIAVRKVNGANKSQLLFLFFLESTIYSFLSIVLAFLLVMVSVKWFFSALSFSIPFFNSSGFWFIVFSVITFGTLFPGILTSVLLSRVNTVNHKNSLSNNKLGFNYRDGLVVLQFVVIIVLISGVLIINQQLKHINSIELGFQKEQVFVLNIPRINFDNTATTIETFENKLNKYANISGVTASSSVPGERFGSGNGGPILSGTTYENNYFRVGKVMPNFIDFYGLNIIAGKNFTINDNGLVLNEEAVAEYGFTDANNIINQKAYWQGRQYTILGVVESFHQESLHISPEPIIFYNEGGNNRFNFISVKLNGADYRTIISNIEKEYNELFSGNPFSYFFLDKHFDRQYKQDIAFQKMFGYFSVLAIIIGSLGLFGLTTYNIRKRIKEIGVRKVNGANSGEILFLLNKDYIKWVVIAFIIACPLAWFAMNKWLQNFAYKETIGWWIFATSGGIALIIALLTVSWQTWRAANKNPVEALRYE